MTNVLYILAASHSGSTLLTMLLNSHPDVATVGELACKGIVSPEKYLCSCGSIISECKFWDRINTKANESNIPFCFQDFGTVFRMPNSRLARRLLGPLHRGTGLEFIRDASLHLLTRWPKEFRRIAHANEVLVGLIKDYYSCRVFVDKGNKGLRLKYLLRIPSFDIKVIHLVRDGRANALTYMDSRMFADAASESRRGGGMGAWHAERLSMGKAAYNVRRCFQEAGYVLDSLDKSQWIRVCYEDLCSDPDSTLNRIFDFIGVDPARRADDFRSVEHHIVGNGMRLDSTSEIRLDEQWKSVLTAEQLAIFDRVAGTMNKRYGYS